MGPQELLWRPSRLWRSPGGRRAASWCPCSAPFPPDTRSSGHGHVRWRPKTQNLALIRLIHPSFHLPPVDIRSSNSLSITGINSTLHNSPIPPHTSSTLFISLKTSLMDSPALRLLNGAIYTVTYLNAKNATGHQISASSAHRILYLWNATLLYHNFPLEQLWPPHITPKITEINLTHLIAQAHGLARTQVFRKFLKQFLVLTKNLVCEGR